LAERAVAVSSDELSLSPLPVQVDYPGPVEATLDVIGWIWKLVSGEVNHRCVIFTFEREVRP
jgi:hypothetical protein